MLRSSARTARRSATGGTAPSSGRDRETHVTASIDAFRRILRQLRLAARRAELATGLSSAQLFVLSAVAKAPGCSLNDVAEATMTDRSSVAAIVDGLVRRRYLTRTTAADDRRRASIAMTARGHRATSEATPPPTAMLVAGLRGLSVTQLRALESGLTALTRTMGVAHEPAGMLFEDVPRGARSAKRSARRR